MTQGTMSAFVMRAFGAALVATNDCDAHGEHCAWYFCVDQCRARGTDVESVCGG